MQEQQGETNRLNGRSDPVGPFGNPDGSRAPIERVLHDFVDFHGDPAFGGPDPV
jgi:hypothetical protein